MQSFPCARPLVVTVVLSNLAIALHFIKLKQEAHGP